MSYNVEITKKIQQHALEIMKAVHKACVENGIKYYLAEGSVLGAIRHDGFIPWDDDLDIMMFREDYERFIRLSNDILPDNLYVQTPDNQKYSHNMFVKVREKNTLYEEEFNKDRNYPRGIFIDVFPIDYVKENSLWFRIKMKIVFILKKMYFFQRYKNANIVYKFIAHLLPHKLCYKWTKKLTRNTKPSKYCINSLSNYKWTKQFRSVDILGNGTLHKFEDVEFFVPEKADEYLSQIYKDYMQLPPEEQRGVQHTVVRVLFDYDDSKYFKK